MKIRVTQFYAGIFAILLLLELYSYSFKINIVVQLIALVGFVGLERQTISKSFLKTILPVIYIFLICFIGTFIHRYSSINIVKDILHFIKPLLGITIGYLFFKKINDLKTFVKTIVITGFISAIIHFLFIVSISKIDNVSDIRQFGTDNFVELFAVLLFGFYSKFQKEQLFQNRWISRFIFISLFASSTLYFSRTMIVTAIIIIVTVYGYTVITMRSIKIAIGILASVLLFYVFLFSININRNKGGVESFLFKVKNAPAEIFKTKVDREDHADLWDHWRGYEAERALILLKQNPEGFVFGLGYGSLVNLKFYAPLSGDKKGMRYISELHNGYIYVLYKTGFIGLLLYLFFLFGLYYKINSNRNFVRVFVSGIAVSILFSTLVVGSIFNGSPTIVYLLGSLLFFDENYLKIKQK
jgi:hypothetical protein